MISFNYPEVALITECFYKRLPSTVVSAALWCLLLCFVRLAATLTAQNLKTMSLKNTNQPISNTATQVIILYINHSNAEATFIQRTKMQRFLKTILTLSSWYSLDSSHGVLSDEYPFSVILQLFSHYFVLAKLATSSTRVNNKFLKPSAVSGCFLWLGETFI